MLGDAASRRRNSHGPKEGPADKSFQERERERQDFEREAVAGKRSAAVEVSYVDFSTECLTFVIGKCPACWPAWKWLQSGANNRPTLRQGHGGKIRLCRRYDTNRPIRPSHVRNQMSGPARCITATKTGTRRRGSKGETARLARGDSSCGWKWWCRRQQLSRGA